MMSFTFRRALKEDVNVIIGLYGASGSGKTMSAMRLAVGLSQGQRFAVIDTEARRALHYADMYDFDHAELKPPFTPDAYTEAIQAADKAGYPVIIVDSSSHSWEGEGGVLEWQEEELTRMAGQDYKKREACKMASWIQPKMAHRRMMQRLLQVNAHLILCFRAQEKTGMKKDEKTGKMVVYQMGWQPICEKNVPYELVLSFLLTSDQPGIPQPMKLQEQHKSAFNLKKPIDEESGRKLLEWASKSTPTPISQESQGVDAQPDAQEQISVFDKPVKPLTNPQKKEIVKAAQKIHPHLTNEEIGEVVRWYCGHPDNKYGGESYESGQALIYGFDTIFDRFLEAREKEQKGEQK